MDTVPRVLVTRPLGQEQALCDGLRELGLEPVHLPLLEIEPLEEFDAQATHIAEELDNFQHVIFISANAVRHGVDFLRGWWPQWPVGLCWYGIGTSTVAALAAAGLPARGPDERMTTEALLELPELCSVDGGRVLIVKGEGGRATMRAVLSARGAEVRELVCYRRSRSRHDAEALRARFSRSPPSLALVSSGDGLEALTALLRPDEHSNLAGLTVVAPSRRVAARAPELGWRAVAPAANASDRAMLAAVAAWQDSLGAGR